MRRLTSATVTLKVNSGFFAKAFYQVTFELPELRVYDINDIPADWEARLVQIGK